MIKLLKSKVVLFDSNAELTRISNAFESYPELKEFVKTITNLFIEGNWEACYEKTHDLTKKWNELRENKEFRDKLDEENMDYPLISFLASEVSDVLYSINRQKELEAKGLDQESIDCIEPKFTIIK